MAVEITREPVQSRSSDKHWTHQNPSTAAQASADHNPCPLPLSQKASHYICHIFLHVWLIFLSVSVHVGSDGYISECFLLACSSDFADPDVLSCLDYRYLYNHCPGPEWNVMCRGCCEYDVIRCKCPLQGTPVGYAVPCCRNAINECDPCIIHPGRTSANIHIGMRALWDVANFITLNRVKSWLPLC